jgi:aspartate kinase
MKVAVVAGFQGISPEGRITTLGRGGSDTTAVAFAAAFGAVRCDIYTDVDGVYTTDPRITAKARRLPKIAFEEMLELASLGAKVLQTRSVELAMRYKVRLQGAVELRGRDRRGLGHARLRRGGNHGIERGGRRGLQPRRGEDDADRGRGPPRDRGGDLRAARRGGVNVDMIVQNISDAGLTDMTFSCPVGQVKRAARR